MTFWSNLDSYLVVTSGIFFLLLEVDFLIVFSNRQPGGCVSGEPCAGRVVPMVRSSSRISGVQHVGLIVSPVQGFHVDGVFPADVAVSETDLFSLVGDGHSWEEHVECVQAVDHVMAEAGGHSVVVVVAELEKMCICGKSIILPKKIINGKVMQ